MRLTAEQYEWRKENRITGVYEIKAPRGFRRGQSAPHCDKCGRETEYLFDGPKSGISRRGEPVQSKVCQRCRPLSELEQKEKIRDILREFNGHA